MDHSTQCGIFKLVFVSPTVQYTKIFLFLYFTITRYIKAANLVSRKGISGIFAWETISGLIVSDVIKYKLQVSGYFRIKTNQQYDNDIKIKPKF